MENASKALIIAGSILISIIIISLGVIVFRNMAGSVERNSSLTQEQISAFNNKILPYVQDNISGSQVNALIQTARSLTQKAINDGNNSQQISIKDKSGKSYLTVSGKTVNSSNVATGNYYRVSAAANENGLLTTITIEFK